LEDKLHNQSLRYIGNQVNVTIDRPLGSSHPKYPQLIYKLDYGFIPNTLAPDGEELDAYVLGSSGKFKDLKGLCIGAVLRFDGDDKLIVAFDLSFKNTGAQQIWKLTAFQEKYFWPERYVDLNGHYYFTKRGIRHCKDCLK